MRQDSGRFEMKREGGWKTLRIDFEYRTVRREVFVGPITVKDTNH